MKSFSRPVVISALLLSPALATAQDYRIRLDAQAQSVWFRGLKSDSILFTDAVPVNDAFETPDGRAVRCGAGPY